MTPFGSAKWIWTDKIADPDEYAEFFEEVYLEGSGAELFISSDSNYAVYMNGALCSFGQYADFPYNKVYDKIDVSRYIRKGKNVLAIRVWYYGIADSSTYYPGEAGLLYSLRAEGREVAYSSSATLSRPSPTYVPYKAKRITGQLGLTFEYDAKGQDAWLFGEADERYPFSASRELGISPAMRERSCERLQFGETYTGSLVSGEGIKPVSEKGMIFDLGREAVGFICLEFKAASSAPITVAFGEHLVDGHVRREVGGRDFSFIYHPTDGLNYYMNPFRRFGCRYVEIITDEEISDARVSLRSVIYPLNVLPTPDFLTLKESKIYEACVYTMQCCMHEHYEDCPWREQALYTMDSRNQMLAGYYAFGETRFPRANLELISEDNRPDGLLSICYPILRDSAIPSFSLHYMLECEEYLRYSGDVEFIEKIYPKIISVLNVFVERIDTVGLVPRFTGANMWNFYEWTDGLDGPWGASFDHTEYDVALNSLLSVAISRVIAINDRLGKDSAELTIVKNKLNKAIYDNFYDVERGLFRTRESGAHYSKLANALAVLAGAVEVDTARRIIDDILVAPDVIDASLSMRGFVYDALIRTDKEKYKAYILDEIDRTYTPMLELGNGTVWETVLGEADFDNAGSLCHGWSAIPIYYYYVLKS